MDNADSAEFAPCQEARDAAEQTVPSVQDFPGSEEGRSQAVEHESRIIDRACRAYAARRLRLRAESLALSARTGTDANRNGMQRAARLVREAAEAQG